MRAWSLAPLLLVCSTACQGKLLRPAIIGKISIKPVPVRVQTQANVNVNVNVQTNVNVATPPPAPVAPVLVSVVNSPVPEFFGIPLDGAQDVVFVLDVSGSMSEIARGRMTEIINAAPDPTAAPPPADAPPADVAPPAPVGPPPAGGPPPPAEPPPMGYPDGRPPPAEVAPQEQAPAPAPTTTTTTRSMSKLEVAQIELVSALERLPLGTRMNVLFFNSELEGFSPMMFTLDETGRANMIGFIKETEATGSTALAPAMRTAFMMHAQRVVLLSDGLGNVGGGAPEILRDAREAMRGGIRIDTIGLGNGQDADLLDSLARESGGLYQAM